MKQIDRIRKFSDAFGPSGFEDAVVAYAQEEVREICTCKEDHMRNLYMNLKGNSQGGVNKVTVRVPIASDNSRASLTSEAE